MAKADERNAARMRDLCPADKSRIGQLVHALAQEKQARRAAAEELERQRLCLF